jgi:antitoxin component YwqK of YwqJK toxin-antitoxin module
MIIKKNSFFIVIPILIYLSCANNNTVHYDIKKEYYPSGMLLSEIYYKKNGEKIKIKSYYESGKIHAEAGFKNGLIHGEDKRYYMSGKLRAFCVFINGKPKNLYKEYYESGKILSELKLKNENSTGRNFYESGELLSEFIYLDDLNPISIKFYDKKGKLLHGDIQVKYNSGKLQLKGSFNEGKPNGFLQSYFESGNISFEGMYSNGKPEGIHKLYFETGQIYLEIPYRDGKVHGMVKTYDFGNSKNKIFELYENGMKKKGGFLK